jgi:hypothetical protein
MANWPHHGTQRIRILGLASFMVDLVEGHLLRLLLPGMVWKVWPKSESFTHLCRLEFQTAAHVPRAPTAAQSCHQCIYFDSLWF